MVTLLKFENLFLGDYFTVPLATNVFGAFEESYDGITFVTTGTADRLKLSATGKKNRYL